MVAAALLLLVSIDTFCTGLMLGRYRRVLDLQAKQAEQISDLVNVSAEHDYSISCLDRKVGDKDE